MQSRTMPARNSAGRSRYIETNVEDIDDYEKEYDRMERDGERLADHQRSVLCNIRDEVDALDTLLQDTRLSRRRMQERSRSSGR